MANYGGGFSFCNNAPYRIAPLLPLCMYLCMFFISRFPLEIKHRTVYMYVINQSINPTTGKCKLHYLHMYLPTSSPLLSSLITIHS
ncbi:hypothetical protein DM02DRAFT_69505 [Periconia macrospinosa]|uniref:Uncharacterized protein n=1 Tax=Periconia macrospinosa TaxID=97972 RepID=A0A2V1E521_9PLEO|nr:hypothetical protein DM02DRAFT_69505 [Periconia macrospinosa]